MLFNSFHFLIFFIIIGFAYFALPHKYRWLLLLTGSCYFYMAFYPVYILILGFTVVIDYFAGILIERSEGPRRKLYLIASLAANIGVLCVFKYYNFLNGNFTWLLHGLRIENPLPSLAILLPIGLSFHTFQAMSYTIEVYRGHHPAERNFGIYALYVMFFPQLVAGPIERPGNLLHQFYEKHSFDYDRVKSGLLLIGWGLFKKVVIADRLAIVVDTVNNNPHSFNSLSIFISALFFTFQAYCDFSGYSDIAIGSARVLGFKLMRNFDYPFSSKSFYEFWKKWHISLSSWFRDYLYIPLGGSRVTKGRWYFNIMVVFLISGLWHGAAWTYVLFGAIQGLYVISGVYTAGVREKLRIKLRINNKPVLSVITTFFLFMFSLFIFRATSMENAVYMMNKAVTGLPDIFGQLLKGGNVIQDLGMDKMELALSFILIIALEVIQYFHRKCNLVNLLLKQPVYTRWAFYYAALAVIVFLGVFENRLFIYFQF